MEKFTIIGATGVVGAFITEMIGGWTEAMTTLCVFMILDYVTGLLVAGVFKNSTKTTDGGLESKAGYKGLIRKFAVLILVLVAARLDVVLGTDDIKNFVIIAFIANECISITENVGLMGVPIPEPITKAITMLNNKEGENK